MSLIRLEFRKQWLQYRIVLGIFAAFVLFDLAQCQEWFGGRTWEPPYYSGGAFLRSMFTTAIFGMGLVLLIENPGWNSFCRTRPIRLRDMWLGRLLFTSLFVFAPLIIVEAVHLSLAGLSAEVIRAGVLERATILIPAGLLMFCVPACTRSPKEFGISIGVLYGAVLTGIGLCVGISHLLSQSFGLAMPAEPSFDGRVLRFLLTVGAVAFGILAWLVQSGRLEESTRWIALSMVGLFLPATAILVHPLTDVASKAQAEVAKAAENVELKLPLGSISMQRYGDRDQKLLGFTLQFRPRLTGLPDDWIVRWDAKASSFKTDNGILPGRQRTRPIGVFEKLDAHLSRADILRIQALLPPETVIQKSRSMFAQSINTGPFLTPDVADLNRLAGRAEVRAEANVVRWVPELALPVRTGETLKDKHGYWQISAVNRSPEFANIILQRRQVWLDLADDVDGRKDSRWPRGRFAFLLHDPDSRIARPLANSVWSNTKDASHTAYSARYVNLQFNEHDSYKFDYDNPNLRLLVFRLDYLGSFEKVIKAPVNLADYNHSTSSGNRIRDKRLDEAEFTRRVRALEAPAIDAGRGAVGTHLFAIL